MRISWFSHDSHDETNSLRISELFLLMNLKMKLGFRMKMDRLGTSPTIYVFCFALPRLLPLVAILLVDSLHLLATAIVYYTQTDRLRLNKSCPIWLSNCCSFHSLPCFTMYTAYPRPTISILLESPASEIPGPESNGHQAFTHLTIWLFSSIAMENPRKKW